MNPADAFYARYACQWEGFEPRTYVDKAGRSDQAASNGVLTVGFGFNLLRSDAAERLSKLGLDLEEVRTGRRDLTRTQAMRLAEADMEEVLVEARRHFPEFDLHPFSVRAIVADLIYCHGITRFLAYKGFIAGIKARRYALAAAELIFRRLGEPEVTGFWDRNGRRAKNHASMLAEVEKDAGGVA